MLHKHALFRGRGSGVGCAIYACFSRSGRECIG